MNSSEGRPMRPIRSSFVPQQLIAVAQVSLKRTPAYCGHESAMLPGHIVPVGSLKRAPAVDREQTTAN